MAESATENQVALRVLIDEKKNKVVFVQAGKDFVDFLLSFLTLPLGTIVRLVSKESNMKKVSIGSLSSLYESVANLDESHFWTDTCKEMLLQPRNAMESYCQNIKLNIDDTEKTKYFICEDLDCSRKRSGGLLSTFTNQRCKCGKPMNREIFNRISPANKGFVPETATFIISDDLKVKPDDFQNSVCLPINLGSEDFDAIKLVIVNVTQNDTLDLLTGSLFSTTPLTDLFLRKKQLIENAQTRSVSDFDIGEVEGNDGGQRMKIKALIRKSNNTILFALAEEDFVDFILSFLTFPLGGVEHMLNGNSCLGSIDNLYNSIIHLDPNRYFRSFDLQDKLVKSQLAHQFKLNNQMLPFEEVPIPDYTCYSDTNINNNNGKISCYLTSLQGYERFTSEVCAPLSYLEPQSSTGQKYSTCGGKGFAKKMSLYMVTDDLVITPSSSISAISFLTQLRIPPSDLEERVINIGKKEGLSLLKASLFSSSALTNGLRQFLKPIKEENSPN
ncbi:uncharacterized protein LOC133286269 [Gastrolobium bilobum]|uniref:uncharacterized protein LOC133286269 n=1 Tax=Gastrolobium bilobum TaxID=150636 RepID=UPI002AB23CA4|nr:uncharacterized protein LOC133286269 [Gastrolobium bilobum]